MYNPYTAIIVMNGMNRFHQKDTEHPFNMEALDGYNTFWLPQVDEIEKTNSTLYYEALKGVETTRISQKREKDDYIFIFGRGTIGRSSEEHLFEAMQSCKKYYGKDVNFVIVAKSFGVPDTLCALKMFKPYHWKPAVKGLFLIDGFLPPSKKRKIAKKVKGERRFKIPKYVERYYNVVQREKGTEGKLVVNDNNNFIVRQTYVYKTTKFYDEYKDGYKRPLLVSHFNMEEIVSAVPCIQIAGDFLKLSNVVERVVGNYHRPKKSIWTKMRENIERDPML